MKLQRPDPGIDVAKSGLHGKAGLFFDAGVFEKGEPSFGIQDLDPYLLFDARESMLGTLENPTLDLDPATPSTLDVITATRAGVATYTDAAGVIQSADPDTVRVDYVQGEELTPTKFQRVGYTDFSSGWGGQSGVTSEAGDEYENQPVRRVIYDGVTTGGIYQTVVNTVGGVSYTGSFYARRISGSNQAYIRHGFSASGNQTILPVTTEWQKFSVTILGASGGGNVYFGLIQFSAGDDVYEITQPQFEEGTTASDFVANTTGSPKFITGATYGPRVPMILVEPSSENLVTYSEDFSQWTSENATIESGAIISPSGSQDGSKISASNSVQRQGINKAQTQSGNLAISVFAKKAEYDVIQITDAINASSYANFNLTSGTVGSYAGYTPKIEPVGNDWFRCSVTFNSSAINKVRLTIAEQDNDGRLETFAGNGTDGLYIWGAQLEESSVATSYIPTSGGDAAARTRAADDLVISGSDFSDFFNGSEGTFFIQAQNRTPELNGAVLMGQNINRLFFYKSSPNRLSTYDGGNYTHHDGLVANQLFNAAVTFNTSNRSSSLDGSALDTDPLNTQWATADILKIGFGYLNNFNGHYRRILFWPYHSDRL